MTPDVKRDRVFQIAQLMAIGEWSDERRHELGRTWQLKDASMRDMAAEASRLLDLTTGQRDTLAKAGRLRLQQIALQDGPDRVQAIRTMFESLGLMTKRVELGGPEGREIPLGVVAKVVMLPAEEKDQ